MTVHSVSPGPRPRRRAAISQAPPTGDKRERIIDAAIKVFAERGFYHARVSEVAKEAGVAGGTIYNYFRNKDDLLINLFEDRMEAILAHFRDEMQGVEGAADRLRRFVELHLAMVAEDPQLAEVLTVELRQSSKFMREYKARKFGEYLAMLEDLIIEGVEQGVFRADVDPKILKRALFGALDEVSLFWVGAGRAQNPQPYALEAAAEQIWRLYAGGLMRPQESTP